MLYILDTDILSLYRREATGAIRSHLKAVPVNSVGVTVITVEEQLTGWYDQIRRAKTKVGNRQSVIRPNHIITTYTYDHLNRLTDVVNANAATNAVGSSYHYTLDADGKRLSVTDNTGATTSYGYDADSRLTSEATPGGTTSYTYDSVGNRLSKTSGGTTTTFTYDADDRNSSSAYTYNANGDVLNDGTHTYSYDFEDHLTASGTGGNQTATYAYDADGNRIQQVTSTGTTNYLVDSNRTYAEVLEERDGSGNVLARYDYGDAGALRDHPFTVVPKRCLILHRENY